MNRFTTRVLDLKGLVTNALRMVLALFMVSLLFACGSGTENSKVKSTDQLKLYRSSSTSLQCSMGVPIAGGTYHSVGLKEDGTVVAVGFNGFGQLGVSSWKNINSVAASRYQTIGLKEDGTVVAVGNNDYGQLNVSSWTDIKAIAAGASHTIGLKEDGTVVAVGKNNAGQLNVSSWKDIKAIAAGQDFTVGLKEDGTVVAVGNNDFGQLNVSSWTDIKAIAAGTYHTVGLKEDGTVVAVGYNGYGQLKVTSWTNIKAIAAGAFHTLGLKEDGTIAGAGNNGLGQLNVSSWKNINAVAAGAYHTIGLKEDGTAVAVGYNEYGQLNVSSLFTDIMPVCDFSAAEAAVQDVTPPITTAEVTGKAGNNGWYVSDVQMTLTATDNEGGSGVKEIYHSVDGVEAVTQGGLATYSIAGDGTHAATWYAVDNAGNVEAPPHQQNIMIDKTPPMISATVSPAPNAYGWNNTDVTVSFACSDKVSGVATCPKPITVSAEGAGQTIIDTAVDNAGNSATVKVTLNIDKTPPTISSLSANPSILWPPNHAIVNVLVGGSVGDSGSGIASTKVSVTDEYGVYSRSDVDFGTAIPLESWRAGNDKDGRVYTITAVTFDKAGNSATGTTSVIVPHDMR